MKRGYSEKEGPFVKTLDNALQSFGIWCTTAGGGGGGGGIYWQPCTQGIEGYACVCHTT